MDKYNKTINNKKILKEIYDQTIEELESNLSHIDDNFTEVANKRAVFIKKIYHSMFNKLFSKLKIKITCYWGDIVIFEYVIPKK